MPEELLESCRSIRHDRALLEGLVKRYGKKDVINYVRMNEGFSPKMEMTRRNAINTAKRILRSGDVIRVSEFVDAYPEIWDRKVLEYVDDLYDVFTEQEEEDGVLSDYPEYKGRLEYDSECVFAAARELQDEGYVVNMHGKVLTRHFSTFDSADRVYAVHIEGEE